MIQNKSFLAIIPARGGSKRLPRKNVLNLNGKPLIAWSIEASLSCDYIDETLVTSDDDEILNISQKYGANIVKRPDALASDTASSFDAIMHAINHINKKFDYIVLLQATSPLRTSHHISEAIKLLIHQDADAVISVSSVDHSPLWSNILPKDGNMQNFIRNEVKNKRSQDLPLYYRLNGAIYICDLKKLKDEKTFFIAKNIYSYIMDDISSVDIDSEIDFELAKILIKKTQ